MLYRRNYDNSEAYRMIWQFTVAPLMLTAGYLFPLLFYLSYIGKTL